MPDRRTLSARAVPRAVENSLPPVGWSFPHRGGRLALGYAAACHCGDLPELGRTHARA